VAEAQALVAARLGLDFPGRRRADLERALTAGAGGVAEQLEALRADPTGSPAWRRLTRALTVRESYFYRDRRLFAALSDRVLPALIAERRERGDLRLRLWSAGCAAGEEPYSLAIVLHRLLADRAGWTLTVLGTDIDPEALAAARRGLYTDWALRDTPGWLRDRYFRRTRARRLELDPEIRDLVEFAPLNLAQETYPSPASGTHAMDLILCRNVLMYFTEDARQATVARLRRGLADGGWLGVSPVDASPELLRPLTAVEFPGCVLNRNLPVESKAPSAPPEPSPRDAIAPPAAALPRDARSLLARARTEADGGRLDRAGELCAAALRADRLAPDAYLLLAAVQQERGDLDAASAALRAAIYADPGSASAHFQLGSLLLRRGASEQGRQSMRTAAGLLDGADPDEPVSGGEGVTAAALRAAAHAYLEMAS
jgi:chemotaxis protein methyltransferase CheR